MLNKTADTIQNKEAEQMILGAILLDPEALLIASETITAADFARESHRHIWNAFYDEYQDSGEINFISVYERLKAKGQLEKAGGNSYLTHLVTITPTAANVRYHARIVKEKAIIRSVKRWAMEASHEADGPIGDLKGWFGDLEKGLLDIFQNVHESRNPYAKSILADIVDTWEQISVGEQKFVECDSKLSALIPIFGKHFWMIGGYTSLGKSALLNQISIDAMERGIRILIFSLEDSREEKIIKLISNLADIQQKYLITGDLHNQEPKIAKAIETIKEWNPIIYDDIYSIEDIRLKAKKHKLQDKINLVAIDYVQNVHGSGDLYQDMRNVSIQLDRMKKDLGVTVIALSQVTNESAKTNSDVIGLKGAGELAAAADIVFWLKRVKGDGRERYLDVEIRKNRPFGQTGILPLIFSEKWTQIDKRGF